MPREDDPKYIDPKELKQIFQSLPVSEMVKITPGKFEYMLQRYEDYVASDGKLDFKSYVKEFFDEELELKKGGLVK